MTRAFSPSETTGKQIIASQKALPSSSLESSQADNSEGASAPTASTASAHPLRARSDSMELISRWYFTQGTTPSPLNVRCLRTDACNTLVRHRPTALHPTALPTINRHLTVRWFLKDTLMSPISPDRTSGQTFSSMVIFMSLAGPRIPPLTCRQTVKSMVGLL